MEILNLISEYPKGVALILGFFDGVHLGHQAVISQAVNYAKKTNAKTVLVTLKASPKEYFVCESEYIFERKESYKLIENLGVDYILELDFASVVDKTPEEYLVHFLINNFQPISITTGFNHTFGKNKKGTTSFLYECAKKYGYKYFCVEPEKVEDQIVSSSLIKELLKKGLIETANRLLNSRFKVSSTVVAGNAIGRKIGFPTANLNYPARIVQIPFGVYSVIVNGIPSILNWGVKPTVNGDVPTLEAHIIGFEGDLYNKILEIEFLKKIRDEKKFNSLDELQEQIKKDITECLRL